MSRYHIALGQKPPLASDKQLLNMEIEDPTPEEITRFIKLRNPKASPMEQICLAEDYRIINLMKKVATKGPAKIINKG